MDKFVEEDRDEKSIFVLIICYLYSDTIYTFDTDHHTTTTQTLHICLTLISCRNCAHTLRVC